MKKRVLAILLSVLMVFSAVPLSGFVGLDLGSIFTIDAAADELAETGYCGENGDNVTWSFDSSTGTLTISGEGGMGYFSLDSPFAYNSDIKNVIINNGVTSIDSSTFKSCESLISITIPDSVTSIGYSAFSGCSSLTNITIPDSVTSIDIGIFCGCDSLTSITVGANNTVYDSRNNCNAIIETSSNELVAGCKNTIIPSGVSSIGYSAFSGCSLLTNITIPDSVTSIRNSAFSGCSALTNITIPSGVTSIGEYAFYRCTSLTSITIPDSVTSIGYNAFDYTAWYINHPDGVVYAGKNCYGHHGKMPENGTIELRSDTKSICSSAFSGNSSLTNIIIPDSVTSIGVWAFHDCTSLTSITIGNGVTSIGEEAFENCTSLTSITIPDSVTSIGEEAFENCTSLTSITIPDSVTSIGYAAFYNTAWCDNQPNGVVYIGKHCYEYKGTMPENTSIELRSDTKSISDHAFNNCEQLASIIIPDSVTSIGERVFGACLSLANITIPNSVTSIGDYAFCSCSSLTSITIPDSVTSIGNYAFGDCSSLTSITIGNSVTIIGDYAFQRCASFTNITIPDSVTSIGNCAFSSCSSLTSITIPDSVTSLGDYAFSSCSSLTSITIPDGVTSIGNRAFSYCRSLTIYGVEGSYAQQYATENSIPFASIDSQNIDFAFKDNEYCFVVGSNTQLELITPSSIGYKDVLYTTSNSQIAHISSAGYVYAKRAGTATITAKTKDGEYVATCSVKVVNKLIPVTEFNLMSHTHIVYENDTEQILTYFSPWNATNKRIIWTSSDESIVKVNGGFITGINAGTATITATSVDGNYTDTTKVTVLSEKPITKTVWYTVEDKPSQSMEVSFSENPFRISSDNYQKELAQFCSQFVTIGYSTNNELTNAFKSFGFNNIEINLNTGRDEQNYFIASKTILVEGKKKMLVFCGLIGSHGYQWNSDFDPYGKDREANNGNGYSGFKNKGKIHLGFEDAKEYVLQKLKAYYEKNAINAENVELLLTGHSRGAATANLLAADIIRGAKGVSGYKKYCNLDDIYTYTFATPNNIKKEAFSEELNDKDYKRIFNFVNPQDFVVWMMPTDWRFTKYGTTYLLPTKDNVGKNTYQKYVKNMESYFLSITDNDEYEDYDFGEFTVYDVMNYLTTYVANVDEYYNVTITDSLVSICYKPYDYFKEVLCPLANRKSELSAKLKSLVKAAINVTSGLGSGLYPKVTRFFTANATDLHPNFVHAHMAETYCAYLMTLDQSVYINETSKGSKYYSVHCPVDVEIYNSDTGELLGRTVNNIVDETVAAGENSISIIVDGDEKFFTLPSNCNYEIKYIGNDFGRMNVTVSSINDELSESERISFYGIDLTAGVEYDSFSFSEDELADYTLLTSDEKTISADDSFGKEDIPQFSVITTTQGNGTTSGKMTVSKGDYVNVVATPNECGIFAGWYSGETLVSEEATYRFCVKEDVELKAMFKENHSYSAVVTAPTCTEKGYSTYTCSVCKDTYIGDYKNALGHKSDDGKITTEPTYDAEGIKTFTCTVCGAVVKTETVAKLEKTYTLGDIDGKDGVTVSDARLALRRAIKLETYAEGTREFLACDVDCSGDVTVSDARSILRVAIKLDSADSWKKN